MRWPSRNDSNIVFIMSYIREGTNEAQLFTKELDWLRGIAILLMVVNHATIRFYSESELSDPLPRYLSMLGSIAPVLFFFATGWGVALSARRRQEGPSHIGSSVIKCCLLILADQLVAWARGERFYLDFFSFIGLSYVALTLMTRLKRWRSCATVAIVLTLAVRFVLGPALRQISLNHTYIGYIVGTMQAPWSSYPPMPWFAYPLLGALFGSISTLDARHRIYVLLAGLVAGAACLALVAQGRLLVRWGTMSMSFFLLGLFALSLVIWTSLMASRAATANALNRLFEVRGEVSFLSVPIHMLLVQRMAASIRGLALPYLLVALLVFGTWAFTIVLAQWLNRVLSAIAHNHTLLGKPLAAVSIGLATSGLTIIASSALPSESSIVAYIGQLAICLLLASSRARKGAVASRGP